MINNELAELLLELGVILDKKLDAINIKKKTIITTYTELNEKITELLEDKTQNEAKQKYALQLMDQIDEIGHNIEHLTKKEITDLESIKLTAMNTVTNYRHKNLSIKGFLGSTLGLFGKIATLGLVGKAAKWTKDVKALNNKFIEVINDVKSVAVVLKTIELKLKTLKDKVK